MSSRSCWAALALCGCLVAAAIRAADVQWTPEQWKDEDTLNLCTKVPDEGEYCFPVWPVVIDGQVYVRLGSKAADRIRRNQTAPILPVEVGGQRFEKVRATETPEYVERVAKAMAEKYRSDIMVRWFSHPLTMRLEPETAP